MSVIDNYKKVIENIKFTCNKLNRNYKALIVAVSKKQNIKKLEFSLQDIKHSVKIDLKKLLKMEQPIKKM